MGTTMSTLADILEHNKAFVAKGEYQQYSTDQFPNKKFVVVTCMDTRLVELLPAAMNLRQGDAKVLKTAGAVVTHPFGSIMRSILVAVYSLGAEEIAVVGHHDCGMTGLSCATILEKARGRGISEDTIATIRHAGVDLEQWLKGFENVADGVRQSVAVIRNHPLLPKDVKVHGLLISPKTGELEVVEQG
ncbi:MAG TPA: carbonic anhydrase [Tepidisphaeraceae bacterium]|jgi:carbonic anhydrase